MSAHIPLEVCIRNGYKYYGPNEAVVIMSDFNMSVPRGSIYVLLGASGSGKTSILKCIVGLNKMNSGYIYVLGGIPNSGNSKIPGHHVGYMPQEENLCPELTIKETLHYFGFIFKMHERKLKAQINFFASLLHILDTKKLIRHLSGGEKRRVSFAAAILHQPELLVLDEPTVGVDPLLRKVIWDYLKKRVKENPTTVILTTHYYEEAKQADNIGLLRYGKLMAEGNPLSILGTFQSEKIESVFLALSQQKSERGTVHRPNKDFFPEIHFKHRCFWMLICLTTIQLVSGGKIKALLMKNMLQLVRNPGVLLFVFLLPVMQVILFCLAIGHRPVGLHLSVVNYEVDFPVVNCPVTDDCQMTHLSCRYLQNLNSTGVVNFDFYKNESQALQSVKEGTSWGLLLFHSGFSFALHEQILLGPLTPQNVLEKSTIKAQLDMSNQEVGLAIMDELVNAFERFAKDMVVKCQDIETLRLNPKIVEFPIQFKEPLFGVPNPQFIDFAAPGVSLVIVFFLSLALMSLMLIVERNHGLMMRSRVAGVHISEIILAHMFTQTVIIAIQSVLILVFLFFVFDIHCNGSLSLVFGLTLLQGICGMCLGLLISAMCNKEIAAIQVAVGFFYPILLLSGIIWPVEGMPRGIDAVARLLPLTSAVMSNRAICIRGWNLSHILVFNGFISVIGWSFIFIITTIIVMRLKK